MAVKKRLLSPRLESAPGLSANRPAQFLHSHCRNIAGPKVTT